MADEELPMDGFPLNAEFLEHLDGEVLELARELLHELSIGSIWISSSMKIEDEDSPEHQTAHMFLGLAHTIMDATLRIAQIESAKAGVIGMDPDIVLAVGRSTVSAMVLAGVRFGQRHPDAFGGTVPAAAIEDLMGLVRDALRGGEADEQDPE